MPLKNDCDRLTSFNRSFFKKREKEVKKVQKNVNTRARMLTKGVEKYYNIIRAHVSRKYFYRLEDNQQLLWYPYLSQFSY